jgi:hypothetical protein
MKVKNKETKRMAFPNLQARLTLWKGIQAAAEVRLANVKADYPAADAALQAKIQANEADGVRTAAGYVAYYEKQLSEK